MGTSAAAGSVDTSHERLATLRTAVLGAIIGAALVFPRHITVELANEARRPMQLELQGAEAFELAPGASRVLRLERWRFRRLHWALLPDGGASRHASSLSPRDYLLYDRLRVSRTQDGLALGGTR